MERTCFAEVQNWLCSYWWVFQWVKWLMKALTPSPCLSFETWKLQLCWTFVKEGLTSVPWCCEVKTWIFQVLSARNGLFQSTEWLEGFGYSWAWLPRPSLAHSNLSSAKALCTPAAAVAPSEDLWSSTPWGQKKTCSFPFQLKEEGHCQNSPCPTSHQQFWHGCVFMGPHLMCCLEALWFIIPHSRDLDNFAMTSCNTHVWSCQVSCVLHLAKVKSIFLHKAVSMTWLHQAGCLSMEMLCVAVNLKSDYESGILLKLDWESVVLLFSVPWVWTEILSCSFCPKPLNGRHWGSL